MIERDASVPSPMFIGRSRQDQLVLSNKYERVYELADPRLLTVNVQTVANSIVGHAEHETVFNGIDTLYDRMRVSWSPRGYVRERAPSGSMLQVIHRREGNVGNAKPVLQPLRVDLGSILAALRCPCHSGCRAEAVAWIPARLSAITPITATPCLRPQSPTMAHSSSLSITSGCFCRPVWCQ